jgi:endonuclease YncB( thermonuclease family)
VYYGGHYYGGNGAYSYSQQPAPASDYGYDGSQGQPTIAIVNQSYVPDTANPVMRDYSNADLPDPGPDYRPQYRDGDQPTIYLLAMTDHTIIPAIAYWADGDTLNYITTEGSQNRVSLSLIDREFSWKLNDSRGVEFKLPPAK